MSYLGARMVRANNGLAHLREEYKITAFMLNAYEEKYGHNAVKGSAEVQDRYWAMADRLGSLALQIKTLEGAK